MKDPDETIAVGKHAQIQVRYKNGELDVLDLDLVEDPQADFANGFLGESSPLAKAIAGMTAGCRVPYTAGDITEIQILAVEPTWRGKPVDLRERRMAVVANALQSSNRTTAIIYASAMNSKWGDYDPGYLQENEQE